MTETIEIVLVVTWILSGLTVAALAVHDWRAHGRAQHCIQSQDAAIESIVP